jgi:hypothetical protein
LKSYETKEGRTINATDPDFLSSAEIKGRLQALVHPVPEDCVPGVRS